MVGERFIFATMFLPSVLFLLWFDGLPSTNEVVRCRIKPCLLQKFLKILKPLLAKERGKEAEDAGRIIVLD